MRQELLIPCPECGGSTIVKSGEVVCSQCGLVIEIMINDKAEWRAFSPEEKEAKSRVGSPFSPVFYDKRLPTTISDVNSDGKGKRIPAIVKSRALMLRKWQRKSAASSSVEKNLIKALAEINRLSDLLSLSAATRNEAAVIYRRILKMNVIRGRSISGLAAASVYAACRVTGITRTLKEVADASGVECEIIGKNYKFILERLEMNTPLINPITYINKIVEKLNLPNSVQYEANEIIRRTKMTLNGKNPMSIAAAAVYIAAKGKVTQKTVARSANITETTIRSVVKQILKALHAEKNALHRCRGCPNLRVSN